jgi:hypothetical protein
MMPWLRWGHVINIYLLIILIYAKYTNPKHGMGLNIMLALLVSFTCADLIGGYLSYKAKSKGKGGVK